jgi:hypothetical protein
VEVAVIFLPASNVSVAVIYGSEFAKEFDAATTKVNSINNFFIIPSFCVC